MLWYGIYLLVVWLFVFALLANISEILLWYVSVLFFFLEESKNWSVIHLCQNKNPTLVLPEATFKAAVLPEM